MDCMNFVIHFEALTGYIWEVLSIYNMKILAGKQIVSLSARMVAFTI